MGGGTSPTCSVKHKLTLTRLLKLAASCEGLVNKKTAGSENVDFYSWRAQVSRSTRPDFGRGCWAEKKKQTHPEQKLTLKADSALQLS